MTSWPWPIKGTRARVIARLLTRVGRSFPRRTVAVIEGKVYPGWKSGHLTKEGRLIRLLQRRFVR